MDRARLTPVDVVFFGVVIFILGHLAGPVYQILGEHSTDLGTAETYLFSMIFPAMILTVLSMIYLTAVSGGAS
ncbi:hypothetical protein [Halobellus sp. Atlit-38R]|uniref:hypothetical protein n=1 Tax=Halobellus sp. Atlit-38R TaxID=2282131 RepID=UPI0011C4A29B|nr:hypothetical protein [Halobellus sp. Atlit-38R]